jgi:hopanoid biosynthesis associated radical SAM protein HpnH
MERKGLRRYPTVLMLEPLYTCNLACIGCSTERHTGKLRDRISPETCIAAAEACAAPIVNICGGEPLLYPELAELCAALIERGRHLILCTNAQLAEQKLFGVIPPSDRLFLMVHLDGMRATHDMICQREGIFDKAIEVVLRARELGYTVFLNTTVYKQTSVAEVEQLCQLVDELKVRGILISPGYEFESVQEDVFLTRDQIHEKFQAIRAFAGKYKVCATPPFLEFAAGLRELPCSPWSTVNYTPRGWKAPCYLIEGAGYFQNWEQFWHETDWGYWESRQDPRCQNCKMHSGFEHSAVNAALATFTGKLRMAAWSIGF